MLIRNPIERRILAKDLISLKTKLGLSTQEACWLFGMSITRWTGYVQNQQEQISDPTLALLVRILSEWRDLSFIPKMPLASDLYETLNEIEPFDKKRFAVFFGSEASAGYRWLKLRQKPSPALGRLFLCANRLLDSLPNTSDRRRFVRDWASMVEFEGKTRGVQSIFLSGRWNESAASKKQRASRRAAKKEPGT
jgi:hypothetical protein